MAPDRSHDGPEREVRELLVGRQLPRRIAVVNAWHTARPEGTATTAAITMNRE